MRNILFSLVALMLLSACTPVGLAMGAGASLGVAASREGGISSTAEDLKVKALISDKWFRYDISTFTKLNLTVNQGRVLITGIVQNPDHRVEAVRLAWQVEGVNQVINEIRVAEGEGLPGYVRDQWITTRLRTSMTFDRDIYSINYSIDTVGGTVYLMGIARNQMELNKVIERARTIEHVKQVVSYVKMSGEQLSPAAAPVMPPPAQEQYQDQYYNDNTNWGAPEPLSPAYQPGAVEREAL